jgi:hypothetical protein
MRIVFLCGSLQPGKDGVGDYTRRLAGELARLGHTTAAIAFRDKYITEVVESVEEIDNVNLYVLRLPSILPLRQRFSLASRMITKANPEWLSIQFVPYAFHTKGLPFIFVLRLNKLTRNRKVQIMIHETWVGVNSFWSWKMGVTSALQRAIIKKMLHTVAPQVVHTHLPAYRLDIENLNHIVVKPLPLFSNIPVIKSGGSDADQSLFRIGFFSQVETAKSVIEFLQAVAEKCFLENKRMEVLLIGGSNENMRSFGEELKKIERFKDCVKYTGFLHPLELSKVMKGCTIGLTPVPRHGLGKSGSVMAFLAHGIPIAAPNIHKDYSSNDIGFFSDTLRSSVITKPEMLLFKAAGVFAILAKEEIDLSAIAKTFISDLI